MSETPDAPLETGDDPRDGLARELSLFDAVSLVVASVIGAGIFFTPGRVAELLPDPGWIFAAWIVGALFALAGALTNAELGAMFPRAGGDYVYLREGVHPAAGFLVGWLSFFGSYAGTIASLAAAFAAGMALWLPLTDGGQVLLAIAVVVACSALNHAGVRWGARANNLTSLAKVAALLVLVGVTPFVAFGADGAGELGRLVPFRGDSPSGITLAAFGLALSPVMFSYLGWNATVFVASEIRDPARNVPRSLFLGLFLCAALYLALNAVYLVALPLAELRGSEDPGQAAATALFGAGAGAWVSGFVLVSVLGTLNATVLVGPRIPYAMALDGLFPGGADRVSAFRTPAVAIWVQAGVAVAILALLRTFPSALDFTTFAILLAAAGDALALIRLRVLRPDWPRPYRAWGYPVIPVVYGVANLALAALLLRERPREAGACLALLALGVPVFRWMRGRAGASASPGPPA